MEILLAQTLPALVCRQNQICLLPTLFADQLGLQLLRDHLRLKMTLLQLAVPDVHNKSYFRSDKGKLELSLCYCSRGRMQWSVPAAVGALQQLPALPRVTRRTIRAWEICAEAAQAPGRS